MSTTKGESHDVNRSEDPGPMRTKSLEIKEEEPTRYAWVVLFIIVFMSICNQWQRYVIGYANGYTGTGDEKGDPKYEITKAYTEFGEWYGVLSGPAFSISYAVCGIFAGVISDNVNRKVMAGVACILWSVTTLASGLFDSFWLFFVMRFFLGLFESPFNPCAYGIIADYFHPKYRTTANSIFNGAIYLGGALSSLGIVMITGLGWRTTYDIIGIVGIGAGLLGLFLVLEPTRARFDPKKVVTSVDERTTFKKFTDAGIEVMVNPTCRWVTIAASCRFFAGYSIGFFMPQFFQHVYPEDKTLYSTLNTIVVSICGFTSAVVGGIISDKLEQKGVYMGKSYVCMIGTAIGIPTIILCTICQSNFYVSMVGLALEYLFAESWIGPAITMVLNTISPANKGFAVSAFLFFATIAGTIATLTLNSLEIKYDAKAPGNEKYFGYILCFYVCIAYAASLPFFWLAGKGYEKVKVEEQRNAEEAEGLLDSN